MVVVGAAVQVVTNYATDLVGTQHRLDKVFNLDGYTPKRKRGQYTKMKIENY